MARIIKRDLNTKQCPAAKAAEMKDISAYLYYIGTGDFGIVWANVVVAILGHLVFFYTFYDMTRRGTFNEVSATWLYGKLLICWARVQ